MNKTQKIIILFFLLVLLFSVLYPPIVIERRLTEARAIKGTGWDWIFNMNSQTEPIGDYVFNVIKRIRFDILLCEILAIVILAGFFIILTKKINKE